MFGYFANPQYLIPNVLKPGQRFLAPNLHISKLKAGEYFVEKIVGVEESNDGRKYKVRGRGYPGQDSWDREVNVAGATAAVEEFWLTLGEPMPESEVFRNKRWKQKIVIDKKATKRHIEVGATERFDL